MILRRLLKYTKPYRIYIFLVLICSVVSILFALLNPVFIGRAIDLIVDSNNVDFSGLPKILLMFLITFTSGAVFQWLMSYFSNIITYRTVKDLRTQLFQKLNKVPLKFNDTTPHGDIINRAVNDIDMVSDALLKGFTQLFTGLTTIIGTLIFMFTINIGIAVAVALLTPLSLIVATFIARMSYKYFRRQSVTQSELTGYINEYVGNLKLIKAFNYETRAQKGFEKINADLYDCGLKAQFFSALTNPCTRFVNGLVYAAVGIIGAVSVIGGYITVGQVSMFLSYANQYTKPFNEISGIIAQLQAAFASAQRVFEVFDEPEESDNGTYNVINSAGKVTINDIYFSYSNEKKLIENLSLSVSQGEHIAIVGPTGCGKTTLINLLMRFYDVDSGEIKIEDVNIKELKREDLRKKYGMVLQDTWLFTGTVRENIAYGIDSICEEKIKSAAKNAYADKFIERLPEGYDTVISEDSGHLSQGQKQLLCIARVMMLDAPMLILDEATSNIDTHTEIAVHHAFSEMMKGRTSFVIAHRLSTIREADLILVMNDGIIVEQGKHEALLSAGGFYSKLYEAMNS
ncbi:MAG: ABC transporter ATP-binding protein/permease [Oscillospiraceae bacterium]|nr:ABC transporter ATP-binding protein/permease [Oscillospiraceae bacterium]